MKTVINIALLVALSFFAGHSAGATTDNEEKQLRGVDAIESLPGQEEDRELASSNNQVACPFILCIDPCPTGQCAKDEICTSRVSQSFGPGCPECREFTGCKKKKSPTCPKRQCRNPCPSNKCGKDEICVSRPTKLHNGCPGCRKFAQCRKKKRQTCGNKLCPYNQVCCNPSCGICTAPGGACILKLCDP